MVKELAKTIHGTSDGKQFATQFHASVTKYFCGSEITGSLFRLLSLSVTFDGLSKQC